MGRDKGYKMRQMGWREPRGVCRADLLFAAGAIAVVGGVLFPLRGHILDVLLIFCTSLTVAVLIIAFSAQAASQVQGLPLLIVLVTTLRMALSVACAKLILLGENAGTIVNFFGHLTVDGNLFAAMLVFGLFAGGVFWIVCKIVRGIGQSGTKFICDIIPMKHVLIGRDLNAGVISESQAYDRQAEIDREAGFFLAMGGTAKFMLCDSVIELVIIVVTVTASLAMCAATPASASAGGEIYGILAVGGGVVTQMSVLVTAMACGYLVRKSSVCPGPIDGVLEAQRFRPERIKVCASEVGLPRTKEACCDETALPMDETVAVDSEFIEEEFAQINNAVVTAHIQHDEELSGFCEYQTPDGDNEEDTLSLWAHDEITDRSDYEAIAELIDKKSCEDVRTVLMAAERVEEFPVTIPVNVGMLLAKEGCRCLLVDLDWERDAVAKVFDDGGEDWRTQEGDLVMPTCISNLWVCPASRLLKGDRDGDLLMLKDLLRSLEGPHDRLIIYAPNLRSAAKWERVARDIDLAMFFGNKESEVKNSTIGELHSLLSSAGCDILEPSEILVDAV